MNQASLTGESLPVEKFGGPAETTRKAALELPNVAFMGTNVVSGTATAVVVTTGPRTFFGSVAASVTGQQVTTSFDRGIHRFIWLLIRFMLVMVPLVFIVNGLTKGDWLEAFLFAVAVAVGLTPELLPMIVTINLAKGALAMASKKVIVKRLNSIQNFGAMDVLCTDKTGTLTQDKVLLEKHVDVFGEESEQVLEYAYLNSYYQTGLKNLLDVAVSRPPRGARPAASLPQVRQGGRDSVRLPAAADVGRGCRERRRAARSHLQGGSRGGLRVWIGPSSTAKW